MPGIIRKLFPFFLLSIINYQLTINNSFVYAQAPAAQYTCDLCGWCNPQINPQPPNWNDCYACLYDTSGLEQKGNYWTVFGCLSTRPEKFVKSTLTIVFGAAGGIAFLAVLGGSAIILTSSGNPQRIQLGKDMITSSIFGLLLIVFSVFLLRIVGFDILKIPGFG